MGPSHIARPWEEDQSSEKGRDLSKELLLHAYCVLGSPFTTSHVSLHAREGGQHSPSRVYTMPSTDQAISKTVLMMHD